MAADSLADVVQQQELISYINIAGLFLLAYDYALTLPMEVDLIWSSQWKLPRFLFIFTRYLPFIDMSLFLTYHFFLSEIGEDACIVTWKANAWMYCIGIGVAEVILTIRTWAIWGGDKRIGVGLCVAFGITWAAACYVMVIFVSSVEFGPLPPGVFTGCYFLDGNHIIVTVWIALIVFETIMLVLMLVRGYTTYASNLSFGLFHILYVDGSLYYACLCALSIVNIACIFTLPNQYALAFAMIQRIMHSIVTGRMLLNLQQYNKRGGIRGEGIISLSALSQRGDLVFRLPITTEYMEGFI